MTRGKNVTASAAPETIHDFGGFPDALYKLNDSTPGAPVPAAHIVDLLQTAGWESRLAPHRGLDYETRVLEGGVNYGVLAMDSYRFTSNDNAGFQSTQLSQGNTHHA